MPELPEVEHVVRGLRGAVLGQRILAVDVNLPRLLSGVSSRTFKRKLRGARIDGVSRRGKYILIELDSLDVLLVHLRMTGKFLCIGSEQATAAIPTRCFLSGRRSPAGVRRHEAVWPDAFAGHEKTSQPPAD